MSDLDYIILFSDKAFENFEEFNTKVTTEISSFKKPLRFTGRYDSRADLLHITKEKVDSILSRLTFDHFEIFLNSKSVEATELIFSSLLQHDTLTRFMIIFQEDVPFLKKIAASWIEEKKTLDVLHISIKTKDTTFNVDLARAIQTKPMISSLALFNLVLPNSFFEGFMDYISSSTTLKIFWISYDVTHVTNPSTIFSVLEKNRFVKNIFFGDCNFQTKDIPFFVHAVKRNTIAISLRLREARDNVLIVPALETLADHPTIKTFKIESFRNRLRHDSNLSIIPYDILLPKLQTLRILEVNAKCFKNVEEFKLFTTGLRNNTSIEGLTITGNIFWTFNVPSLLDALCFNTTLQKLSLPNSVVHSHAYPFLEKLLSVNFTLAILELRSLRISKNLLSIMENNFTLFKIKARLSERGEVSNHSQLKEYLHRNQKIEFLKTATLFELLFPRMKRSERIDRLLSEQLAKKREKRARAEISQSCSSSDSVISLD